MNKFIMKSSTFIGQRESGTALSVVQTTMSIEKNYFISNQIGSCFGPFGDIDNSYALVGGATMAIQSSVTIMESVFKDNSAKKGGSICAICSNITTIDSNFSGNRADVTNSNISDVLCRNRANSGGVLYAEGNNILTLSDSTLFDNQATEVGGVMVVLQSEVTFSGT